MLWPPDGGRRQLALADQYASAAGPRLRRPGFGAAAVLLLVPPCTFVPCTFCYIDCDARLTAASKTAQNTSLAWLVLKMHASTRAHLTRACSYALG